MYFESKSRAWHGKLRKSNSHKKRRYDIYTGTKIFKNVNASKAISNEQLIIFKTETERVAAIDLGEYVDLWYNNPLRRKYIVDKKSHHDAKNKSQFINAPSAKPDTINAYLNSHLVIVQQGNTLKVIKPGDIKKMSDCWILITSIYQTTATSPQWIIIYQKIFDTQQLIRLFAKHLGLFDQKERTNYRNVINASIQSNLIQDNSSFLTTIRELSSFNQYHTLAITSKHYSIKSSDLYLEKFCISIYSKNK